MILDEAQKTHIQEFNADTLLMSSHLIPTPSLTLNDATLIPKRDYRGQIQSLTVRRNGVSIAYQRTNRRAIQVFDASDAPLHTWFSSTRDFSSALQGTGPLLDLGCGGGGLVQDLRRLGLPAIGADLYLEEHQDQNSVFVRADAYHLPFQDHSFSTLLSIFSVFHYEPISRLRGLLAESLRVLRPGGRILIPQIGDPKRRIHLFETSRKLQASVLEAGPSGALQILKF